MTSVRTPLSFFAFFTVVSGAVACGTPSTSPGTSSSALSASEAADGGVDASACLTTYAECVRGGSDAKTCGDALHECMRPPAPARDCDGGPHAEVDGGPHPKDGDRPPPGGDHGGPPDGDHDGPPPDGDHDGGLPLDADGGHAGPHACIDALTTCAQGTDAIDTCVATAVSCFDALPPPPQGGPHR